MARKIVIFLCILTLCMAVAGCGSKIRYMQSTPEAKEFHPERIAVLAVDTDAFPEAEGKCNKLIADVLDAKGWFKKVEPVESVKKDWEKDEAFKKTVFDYLNKLKMVSFSDPDLSKKIAERYGIQAFIVGKVDLWNYSTEGGKTLAKVGMELRLINAETGKIVWRANHNRIDDYWLIKPDLSDMARKLIKDMIWYLPH